MTVITHYTRPTSTDGMTCLVHPSILAKHGVKSSFLESPQLESEPWPQLLQAYLLRISENVPVEDQTALVTKPPCIRVPLTGAVERRRNPADSGK